MKRINDYPKFVFKPLKNHNWTVRRIYELNEPHFLRTMRKHPKKRHDLVARHPYCAKCGLSATHFILARDTRSGAWHGDFYGIDADGDYVALTIDHIQPKSKGGSNHLDNLQVLCKPCNEEKADRWES